MKKIDLYFEPHMSKTKNYVVRMGGRYGQYLGQVTKRSSQWRAYLGPGIAAMGRTKEEAVLKALEKKREVEKHVQFASGL